jgi:hypothetical protein
MISVRILNSHGAAGAADELVIMPGEDVLLDALDIWLAGPPF